MIQYNNTATMAELTRKYRAKGYTTYSKSGTNKVYAVPPGESHCEAWRAVISH